MSVPDLMMALVSLATIGRAGGMDEPGTMVGIHACGVGKFGLADAVGGDETPLEKEEPT